MIYKFYVMMRRVISSLALTEVEKEHNLRNGYYYDYVAIYTFEDAVDLGWIRPDGSRNWVVPPCDEDSPTFVWGFNDETEAINFACSLKNEIGIKIVG